MSRRARAELCRAILEWRWSQPGAGEQHGRAMKRAWKNSPKFQKIKKFGRQKAA